MDKMSKVYSDMDLIPKKKSQSTKGSFIFVFTYLLFQNEGGPQ